MNVIGLTVVGKVRSHNEDVIFNSLDTVGPLPNLFIVADGMGGHNAGEVASAKAVEHSCAFLHDYESIAPKEPEGILNILLKATHQANREVYKLSTSDSSLNGMGTTFTACCVLGEILAIAHIGDSRIYALKNGELCQITKDQTMVQELLDAGKITPGDARSHPRRNVLTRVLGCDPLTEADGALHDLHDIDSILMCSDGLTDMLTDEEIHEIIKLKISTETRAEALINAANNNGGIDNISAIIIDL